MQPQQMFGLPYERGKQFRDFLDARDQSFAEFVTGVIRAAAAADEDSTILDVPEFHIKPEIAGEAHGFVIGFADLPKTFMPREIVAELADILRQAANLKERFRETQGDTYFRVARQSKGVRVTIPANSMTRKYSADLAQDIAAQIDRALDAE